MSLNIPPSEYSHKIENLPSLAKGIKSKSLLSVQEALKQKSSQQHLDLKLGVKKRLKSWIHSLAEARRRRKSHLPQRKLSLLNIPSVEQKNAKAYKETADFICNKWISHEEEHLENQNHICQKIRKLLVEGQHIDDRNVRIEIEELQFLHKEQTLVKRDVQTLTTTIADLEKLHFETVTEEIQQMHNMNLVHTEWENAQFAKLKQLKHEADQTKSNPEGPGSVSSSSIEPYSVDTRAERTVSTIDQLKNVAENVWNNLQAVCKSFEQDFRYFQRLCFERRQRDIDDLARYKVVQHMLDTIFQEQSVFNNAVEDEISIDSLGYRVLGIQEVQILIEIMNVFYAETKFPPTFNPEEKVLKAQLLKEKTLVQAATEEMRMSVGVKQLQEDSYITDFEGYILSTEKVGQTPMSFVFKATSELDGEENLIISYKEFKLSGLDIRLMAHVKSHSFRILRYINRNPNLNIVRILDILLTSKDNVYILEEYLTDTLKMVIEKDGPQTEEVAKKYATDIARGVHYLHGIGVAHQNISPSSIFKGSDGTLKIGFIEAATISWDPHKCKVIKQKGHSLSGIGTFIAPETVTENYNPLKTDIYSFGLVLLYMVLGNIVNPTESKLSETTEYWETMDNRLQNNLTTNANDLIFNCVQVQPELRFSIERVLCHPWLIK